MTASGNKQTSGGGGGGNSNSCECGYGLPDLEIHTVLIGGYLYFL